MKSYTVYAIIEDDKIKSARKPELSTIRGTFQFDENTEYNVVDWNTGLYVIIKIDGWWRVEKALENLR